jgi:hypothetical protein
MRGLIIVLLLASGAGSVVRAADIVTGGSDRAGKAVHRAIALLPRRPERVVIVRRDDPEPLVRMASRQAEGFVPRGGATVYLVEEGPTLRRAAAEGGIFDHALAIIVWHEMAHAAGADERQAQRIEQALWQRFIVEGRVERRRGAAYLALLAKRK